MTEDKPTVATVADEAAEAVGALNFLTHPAAGSPGLTCPSDVYALAGSLALLADELPQLLAQASTWLGRRVHGFEVSDGIFASDPVSAVATAQAILEDARIAAAVLCRRLHDAQDVLTHLAKT